ncbi:MAG: AI-2E family transporter [Gammaproteobacteria bacterium]|nr:AI-2E family transporter [Gammaproteobacteria bacterium]NVK89518.1 AI-2E family transporter [Gammaproteobacteria bacterium]
MGDLKRWWWLGVILVLTGFVYLLSPILTPFFLAATFAYLGDPLADWLESKKLNRTMAVVVVFLVFTLLGMAAVLMMVPLLKQQVDLVAEKTPVVIEYFKTEIYPWISEHLGSQDAAFELKDLERAIKEQLTGNAGLIANIMKSVSSSGLALFAWLGNLVLIPVVTFYLLRDWDILTAKTTKLFPRHVEPVVKQLAGECNEVLSAFVRGQLLVMLALGIIYAVGLYFVGLDLALLVGMIAGLASIVPYLGFIIGIIFAVIAALIQFGDPQVLIWIALVFAIGQMLEGMVLTPLLVGDKIGLHPVAVIFAVLAGGQLFGFLGVLLALPVAAVIMVLLRHGHDRYINSVLYGNQTHGDVLAQVEVVPEAEASANQPTSEMAVENIEETTESAHPLTEDSPPTPKS